MDMRETINLIEAAGIPAADKDKIISHFMTHLLGGLYWDDRAPSDHQGESGELEDIWETYCAQLPPEIKQKGFKKGSKTPEFRNLISDWASARFDNVFARLKKIRKRKGGYQVSRVMKVYPAWLQQAKSTGKAETGLYWTYDLDGWDDEIGSYAVWADKTHKGSDIMLHAVMPFDSVDWPYTIMAGMDWFSGDREFEMRAKKGSIILVEAIVDQESGEQFDLSGITFVA